MEKNEEYVNFDPYADIYDMTRAVSPDILNQFVKTIRDIVPKSNNLLEIACGTGRITQSLINFDFSVTGIDVSKRMLEKANMKSKNNNWSFNAILTDTRFLPLKSNSFDIIITVHILHLIKDWKKVMEELLRCLNTSGVYIFAKIGKDYHSTPPFKNYWKFLNENYGLLRTNRIGLKNQQEIENYMRNKGYQSELHENKIKISIKKGSIIELVKGRFFSSHREVSDMMHNEVMDHLKKNNYFLSGDNEEIYLDEGYKIWVYYNNQ